MDVCAYRIIYDLKGYRITFRVCLSIFRHTLLSINLLSIHIFMIPFKFQCISTPQYHVDFGIKEIHAKAWQEVAYNHIYSATLANSYFWGFPMEPTGLEFKLVYDATCIHVIIIYFFPMVSLVKSIHE